MSSWGNKELGYDKNSAESWKERLLELVKEPLAFLLSIICRCANRLVEYIISHRKCFTIPLYIFIFLFTILIVFVFIHLLYDCAPYFSNSEKCLHTLSKIK